MLNGSLSEKSGLIAILYVVLSGIAVVSVDLRLVLIPTAFAVLGLVVGGFLIIRPLKVEAVLPWPARSDLEDDLAVIVINGQPCPLQGYEQDLLVEIRPRRLTELLGGALLAAVSLYVMLSTHGAGDSGYEIGAFEAELICMAGLMILLTSLRWFTERYFLWSSRFAFGSILGRDPGFFRRGLSYQFFDQHGDRRGGRGPLQNEQDSVVLVLYRSSDADKNTAHGAFMFHAFNISLLPGRRKVMIGAGAQS